MFPLLFKKSYGIDKNLSWYIILSFIRAKKQVKENYSIRIYNALWKSIKSKTNNVIVVNYDNIIEVRIEYYKIINQNELIDKKLINSITILMILIFKSRIFHALFKYFPKTFIYFFLVKLNSGFKKRVKKAFG